MQILDWARAHPVILTAVVWPLLTALLTSVFHSRSPEEYAAKNPRVAAFWKLVAAVGVDVPKVIDALGIIVAGTTPKERSLGVARLFAAFVVDIPKASEALVQLILGKANPA